MLVLSIRLITKLAEEDKWEIELRKELEKKKKEGDNTEQKLKEEQLAKEKAIRDRVTALVRAANFNLLVRNLST